MRPSDNDFAFPTMTELRSAEIEEPALIRTPLVELNESVRRKLAELDQQFTESRELLQSSKFFEEGQIEQRAVCVFYEEEWLPGPDSNRRPVD